MIPKFSKLIILICSLCILSSCSSVLRQNSNSYERMNNETYNSKPSWLQSMVLSVFEILKEDKENKYSPKVSVHPDNQSKPLPFGQ